MSALFDPGLQPERTALAWRRTCLAFLVLSAASFRVLPERLGAGGYVGSSVAVVLSSLLLCAVHARYRWHSRQSTSPERPVAGGALPATAVALAIVLALIGATTVLATLPA